MGAYPSQQCEQAVDLLKDCLVSLTTKLSSNGTSQQSIMFGFFNYAIRIRTSNAISLSDKRVFFFSQVYTITQHEFQMQKGISDNYGDSRNQ